ncbi:hypothetical protein C8J57DRAFT_1382525 [Mycena rebaudengoi]|nr:hypothetical protein C8J57DRAFT_1382525 [Mycena rebaudengoi]
MLGGRRTRHDWKLALDDAEKAEIEQEIEDSESFESSAAVTLVRRENCRKDLEAGWEGPGSVWKAPLPALTKLILQWLSGKTRNTRPTAKRAAAGQKYIAYSTLKSWRDSVARTVCKYVEDGKKKLNDGLYDRIVQHCNHMVTQYDLERLMPRKTFAGRHEVRLMTEANYAMAVNLEWALQADVILKAAFLCGVRPGAIGPSNTEYAEEGKFLKWKHIEVYIEEMAKFDLRIDWTALKGYNGIAQKRLSMNLRSCWRPENIVFEIAPPLLLLALHRGGIKGIKDLSALLTWKSTRIEWEPDFLEQPVVLAGRIGGAKGCQRGIVLRAKGVSDVLRSMGNHVGLDLTAYPFRRNFCDEIQDATGKDSTTRVMMAHAPNSKTLMSNYSRASENIDALGALTAEGMLSRQDLNQWNSLAMQPAVGHSTHSSQAFHHLASATSSSSRKISPLVASSTHLVPRIIANSPVAKADTNHPDIAAFLARPERIDQQAKLDRLRKLVDAGLQELPDPADRERAGRKSSIADRITLHYSGARQTQLLQAHDEWIGLRDSLDASLRRKVKKVNEASVSRAAAAATPAADTIEHRQQRRKQFAKPSPLLDVALEYATIDVSVETGRVDLDELCEAGEVQAFEEVGEPDVNEIPSPIVRAGYMRMLAKCAVDTHVHCPDCLIDPTTSEVDKSKQWTRWALTQHQHWFHEPLKQSLHWFKLKGVCFLCEIDGHDTKLGSISSYNRHVRADGPHGDDARLYQQVIVTSIPVRLPSTFIAARDIEMPTLQEQVENIVLPDTFADADTARCLFRMSTDAPGFRWECLDSPPPLQEVCDVKQMMRKRRKLNSYSFKFVYEEVENEAGA